MTGSSSSQKNVWVKYLKMKLDYSAVPFFGAQDALSNMRSSPATSVVDQRQPSLAASAVVDYVDDDNDLDLEGPAGRDVGERVDAKLLLRDSQDVGRAMKRQVLGTVAESFTFATASVNLEPPAEADP